MEFSVHTALYWERSRLEGINSRTRKYYHLNLSPSLRGSALLPHQDALRQKSFAPSRAGRSNEIREIIREATVFRIAIAAHAGELSRIYTNNGGSYDDFIHAGRHDRRMQASR